MSYWKSASGLSIGWQRRPASALDAVAVEERQIGGINFATLERICQCLVPTGRRDEAYEREKTVKTSDEK